MADHVVPVRVAPDLRLEVSNGQGLCRDDHALKTAEERQGLYYSTRLGGYVGQTLQDPVIARLQKARRVLVVGSPCSGKTTFARRWSNGARRVRADLFFRELTGEERPDNPTDEQLAEAMDRFNREAERAGRIWVEAGRPTARSRMGLARAMRADLVVLISTPRAVCLERAQSGERPDGYGAAVDRWWDRFEEPGASERDRLIIVRGDAELGGEGGENLQNPGAYHRSHAKIFPNAENAPKTGALG